MPSRRPMFESLELRQFFSATPAPVAAPTSSQPRPAVTAAAAAPLRRVAPPPAGQLYHGVFPGGSNTWEEDITPDQVTAYERSAGKKAAWVYFSDNWFNPADRKFPAATANWIRQRGSTPYVRLMTRTAQKKGGVAGADPVFTLQRIIDGQFDADLRAWATAAKNFGSPLIAEWGTEFNGDWFNWNGKWSGGATTNKVGDPTKPDGPERFVAAYRHIVQVMRAAGAGNVTWVWHANATDWPAESWNRMENYYPGNDVVDWVGLSLYGSQRPTQARTALFRADMDAAYRRLSALAPSKPVVVSEFGATATSAGLSGAKYAAGALNDLLSHRWSRVIGFAWWNERWQNDTNPAWNPKVDTDMRLQDNADLAGAFRTAFRTYSSRVAEKMVTRV